MITKVNGNGKSSGSSDTESELGTSVESNEMFEQFMQTCVKYMMSRGRQNNLITPLRSFEKLRTKLTTLKTNTRLSLFDLVVYELCVRLCAQSLFFTNSGFYFNLALEIVVNLVGESSMFNLRLKKSSNESTGVEEANSQRVNLLSNYKYLIEKQSIKNNKLVNYSI